MADNNTIPIHYSDERLRVLVEEYITQQRSSFTLRGVCSYILYWAMEEGNANGVYDGFKMSESDARRVNHILQQIAAEGRIAADDADSYLKLES